MAQYPGKDVAMGGVEGDIGAEAVLGRERVGLVAGNALAHAAVGVDGCGDAVVGVAQQPAAVLDGPHARHVQVLPGGAGVAVPAVVADIHQHLGAIGGKMAHFVSKHGFVADENAVAMELSVRPRTGNGVRSVPRSNLPTRPVSLLAKNSRFS